MVILSTNLNFSNIFLTGAVQTAEVKHKKSQESDEIQSTFAFITISVDDQTLEQLLREFKEQPFRGQRLQVSVARENFLEKLKREREEAGQHQAKKTANAFNDSSASDVRGELPSFSVKIASDDESSSESSSSEEEEEPVKKTKPILANSRYFGSEDEVDEVDSTFLKKKSKRFLENGKVSNIFIDCIKIKWPEKIFFRDWFHEFRR